MAARAGRQLFRWPAYERGALGSIPQSIMVSSSKTGLMRDFLLGSVSLAALREGLQPDIELHLDRSGGGVEQKQSGGIEIPLSPGDCLPVLHRFVLGQLDSKAVAEWALAVRLLPFENPPLLHAVPDDVADGLADPVWDMLSELSSPAIFGELTTARAHEWTERLLAQQRAYDALATHLRTAAPLLLPGGSEATQLLLAGYFHQDWDLDDPNPSAVVDRFVRSEGPDVARAAACGLQRILANAATDTDVVRALESTGASFLPRPGLAATWLGEVVRVLNAA